MDSRTIKATVEALAASPREIAEAWFDPKTGVLVRVSFVPSEKQADSAPKTERDSAPKVSKATKKSAVVSLKLTPPQWEREPEESNG